MVLSIQMRTEFVLSKLSLYCTILSGAVGFPYFVRLAISYGVEYVMSIFLYVVKI